MFLSGHRRTKLAASVAAVGVAAAIGASFPSAAGAGVESQGAGHEQQAGHGRQAGSWVQSWSMAETPPAKKGISARGFDDQTVRMIVHSSAGGHGLRIRLSNEYAAAPLDVGAVSAGVQRSGASVVPGTIHPLTFGGDRSVVIPAGGQAYSDPIRMNVPKLSNLVVSVYFPNATGPTTWHPTAQQVNYVSAGNNTADVSAEDYATTTQSWFYLEGVAVRTHWVRGTVVAFGDSITDGYQSTVNANHRWPDYLARRLLRGWPADRLAVVNEGISGNRVISNAGVCCGENPVNNFGTSAVSRFAADVNGNAAVETVIFVEGINDIGNNAGYHPGQPLTAEQLIDGMQNIIAQAHAQGLRILGGTLVPYKGAAYYTARGERIRQKVNHWIRGRGAFDGVVDFAEALQDPRHPKRIKPEYDSGDHLHPNDAGYRAMANAVDLSR